MGWQCLSPDKANANSHFRYRHRFRFRHPPTLLTQIGAWAVQAAEQYPLARVIGIDLNPLRPAVVPSNCEFVVGDLTQGLGDYGNENVDLVHARFTPIRCVY